MNFILLFIGLIAVAIDIFCPMFMPSNECVTKSVLSLLVNVSYSYIISYVFYLVALIPARSNNKKMKSVTNNQVKLVVSELDKLFTFIYDEGKTEKTEENLCEACKKLNPQIESLTITLGREQMGKLHLYHPKNSDYILYLISNIIKQIDEISNLVIITNIEIYEILEKIKKAQFTNILAQVLKSISNGVTRSNSLEAFYSGIKELYTLKKELETKIELKHK